VTAEVLNRFSKKIKKSKNAAGFVFATEDLPNEYKEAFQKDCVTYLILENVEVSKSRSIRYAEIKKRIATLEARFASKQR
jgi:hypothetical protein